MKNKTSFAFETPQTVSSMAYAQIQSGTQPSLTSLVPTHNLSESYVSPQPKSLTTNTYTISKSEGISN